MSTNNNRFKAFSRAHIGDIICTRNNEYTIVSEALAVRAMHELGYNDSRINSYTTRDMIYAVSDSKIRKVRAWDASTGAGEEYIENIMSLPPENVAIAIECATAYMGSWPYIDERRRPTINLATPLGNFTVKPDGSLRRCSLLKTNYDTIVWQTEQLFVHKAMALMSYLGYTGGAKRNG